MESAFVNSYAQPLSPSSRKLALWVALVTSACIFAAVYAPAALGIACAVLAGVAFFDRPFSLLLVMVFLIPFNFVVAIGPIPVATELLKVFAWIPFLCSREARSKFRTSRYNKWFAVWGAIIALSLLRSNDFAYTVKECVRLISNIGLVYLALNLVDSREKLLRLLKVLTVSTFLVACYGFYQFAIQDYGSLFWIVNPRLHTSLSHYREEFWPWRNRMISVLTSEMELGHYFNLCLPIAALLWFSQERRRVLSKWFLMLIAMLVGLLLTFTFGAWLALAATTGLFVLLLDQKRRWKLLAGALLVSLVGVLLIVGPLRPFAEAKFFGGQVGSFEWDVFTRLKAWSFALATWKSHPVLGVGIGNYEVLSAESDWLGFGPIGAGSTPHETYFYLLAESGIIGLFSMLAIMISSIRNNFKLNKHPQLGLIGLALSFSIVVNLIGGFSDDSPFDGPHASYLLWLVVGLSEAVVNLAFGWASQTRTLGQA